MFPFVYRESCSMIFNRFIIDINSERKNMEKCKFTFFEIEHLNSLINFNNREKIKATWESIVIINNNIFRETSLNFIFSLSDEDFLCALEKCKRFSIINIDEINNSINAKKSVLNIVPGTDYENACLILEKSQVTIFSKEIFNKICAPENHSSVVVFCDPNLNNLISIKESYSCFNLNSNKLFCLDSFICKFSNLKTLKLSNNKISFVSFKIGDLVNLEYLNLGCNNIQFIPASINKLTKLTKLSLNNNCFFDFPNIKKLTNLECLDVRRINKSKTIPIPIWHIEILAAPQRVLADLHFSACSLRDPLANLPQTPRFVDKMQFLKNCSITIDKEQLSFLSNDDLQNYQFLINKKVNRGGLITKGSIRIRKK